MALGSLPERDSSVADETGSGGGASSGEAASGKARGGFWARRTLLIIPILLSILIWYAIGRYVFHLFGAS